MVRYTVLSTQYVRSCSLPIWQQWASNG